MSNNAWVIIEYSSDLKDIATKEADIARKNGIEVILRKKEGARRVYRIFSDWGNKKDISDVLKYVIK
jgi:hypothetical protein